MAGKINAEWHAAHPMPKNPTMDQRIEWHLEHQRECHCREGLPRTVQEALAKRGAKQA
jgi:hypothetical protein